MNRKRIWAAVLLLCMALTACSPKNGENPKNTEAASPPNSTESTPPTESNPKESTAPTESVAPTESTAPTDSNPTGSTPSTEATELPEPTDPSQPTEPEETEAPSDPTEESQEVTENTTETIQNPTTGNVQIKIGCYDNDTAKVSLAFLEDGTVYLMEADGYWKGEYLATDRQVELVFEYKTERGALNDEGELVLEGRDGSFHAVGDSNGWGSKLSAILGDGEIPGTMTELIGSWYNQAADSTLVFNADGSLYQVLSAVIMEGSCQKAEDGYILSFSLGGKVFGPYSAQLNGKGELVLEGQEGVYIKQ